MPWSESDAMSYMTGSKTFDEIESKQTSQPADEDKTSTGGNVEPPAADTDKADTSNTLPEDKSTSQDDTDSPEKGKDNTKGKGHKYSPEDKTKHAFKKQKAKYREAQEKLAAKQKEIDDLVARLKKYEGLTKEDFKNDEDAYQDYKIDQRFDKEKAERLKKELEDEKLQQEREEAAQINEYRLQQCFPDEAELNKYQGLIMRAESNYAAMHPEIGYGKFSEFLQSEKDGTIISYLQDSDNSPKLIRHFINKPEAALRIMQMRNPYNKVLELKQLENRMLQFERMKAKAPVVERKLPDTGKVVANNTNEMTNIWDKKVWSEKDALNYLQSRK